MEEKAITDVFLIFSDGSIELVFHSPKSSLNSYTAVDTSSGDSEVCLLKNVDDFEKFLESRKTKK